MNRTDDSEGRFGFDENRSYLSEAVSKFVPQWLARRSIAVSIATDKDRYARGETVEITIGFRNRLPVPVTVVTPRQRLWGWTVDGELAASDERVYTRRQPGTFDFRPRERKRVVRRWDGQFERTDGPDGATRWEPARRGEHELVAFLALEGRQPSAATTITIR